MGNSQDKTHEWFATACIFPILEYDLLEVQPYAAILYLKPGKSDYDGVYIPVNLGFRKSFLQWEMLSMQFDLAMGAAAYTQFEIVQFDESTFRGGLLNTDFKASGFLFAAKERHKFRMQLFHISSHLGDDYILRNQDFELNDRSVNYEQLDITYLYSFDNVDLYFLIGQVIGTNIYRERFMIESGAQGKIPLKPAMDLSLGCDIKIYAENDYKPNVHACLGISINQRQQPQINFSVDTYVGAIPYSTLDFGQVFWIGLSSRVYL